MAFRVQEDFTLPSPSVACLFIMEYRGSASQTSLSVHFCLLLQSAVNTLLVSLLPPPQSKK